MIQPQPQVNEKPRCECPRCQESRRMYGKDFDAMTDKFFDGFIKGMEEFAASATSKASQKAKEPKVKIIGDVPPGLEPIIRKAISSHYKQENQPKEDISLAEKYRRVSIRKASKDFDPEENVWDEEDTMQAMDDEVEPEWLKQETPEQLQEQVDQAEGISSLLTLVEAMRQQLMAARRMNDATMSILEVLSSQL